ncbi:hypothetical protein D5F01_LYC02306 [Larimichthys crocea]|uniref:Uncharacterized protein n=1 Tax=Larimichthys crocea TaxID=215358 RepID=A0A6G0J242_LARCR|nr:hypothetical protein D5F01_LYC02306 [Larimichthys crocea]
MPATPCKGRGTADESKQKNPDLKDDIRQLSDELQKKDSLLSSFMDVALQQSKRLASLSTTLHDTVAWDPATCPRPSSCSTPNHQSSWADVVVRNRKRGAISPPRLSLSNHYAALPDDTPAHPPDAPAGPAGATAPSPSDLDPQSAPADTATFPQLVAGSARMAGHSTTRPNGLSSTRSSTSSSRCRILKEADTRALSPALCRRGVLLPGSMPLPRHGACLPRCTVTTVHSPVVRILCFHLLVPSSPQPH